MTAKQQTSQASFVFLRGTLLKAPLIRDGRSATLLIEQNGIQAQVKLRGPARVETVSGRRAGDRVVVMGHLESHFDTRARSHLLYVRAVVILPQDDTDGVDWSEFGLPTMLGRIYQKLAEEEQG